MDTALQRSGELKQALIDFVLDAEGELAIALEKFSAAQLSRSQQADMNQRSLVVERFVIEEKVNDQTPLELFLATDPNLTASDRALMQHWHRSFVGLFAIVQILPNGFELMNWTTARHYRVSATDANAWGKMARLKEGEIILAQIAPMTEQEWIFFSQWTALGKLGKPKLAVAIGNFRQNYKQHLYSDAPDLLEEAWKSVEQYHQDFIDFFGSNEVTLPGYQLNQKLAEFQQVMTEKRLQAAGWDGSQSLDELAEQAEISQDELDEVAETMGFDRATLSETLRQKKPAMAAPQVELPAPLKKAEQVTVLTHPRCGQVFLTTYAQFKAGLTTAEPQTAAMDQLMRQYLEDPEIPAFVWYHLAEHYPTQLETGLRTVLQRPDFHLESDLKPLLAEFDKSLETELPDIASVPLHLHNLFQDAIVEVSKDKKKKPRKTAQGF